MVKVKQVAMGLGTFSVALGIGFFMQNGDALASRFSADTDTLDTAAFSTDLAHAVTAQPAGEPSEQLSAADGPELVMPDMATTSVLTLPNAADSALGDVAPTQLASLNTDSVPQFVAEETINLADDSLSCVPEMMGSAIEPAMVRLTLTAPCLANTPFTIHHQGMMFSAQTDDEGRAKLTVPALAELAVIIAAFDNGDGAVSSTVVPDFAAFDRAILQWDGVNAVALNAYEGASDYGEDGHINRNQPGSPEAVLSGSGGVLMQLGDQTLPDALMAEVYIYPSEAAPSDVMLVAEAEITEGNCGRELNAQSLQIAPNGASTALDLVMMMPDCEAVGDFLVLQNMFEDLTLASR